MSVSDTAGLGRYLMYQRLLEKKTKDLRSNASASVRGTSAEGSAAGRKARKTVTSDEPDARVMLKL